MATVAEIIHQHHAEILSHWKSEAQRAASARGLSGPAFNNIMPIYLSTLADQPDARAEQAKHIESHLSTRMRQGFDLAEIHEELLILGRSIAAFWASLPQAEQPSAADVERLHSNLQVAALDVTRLFQEHMQSDEQNEKRYLRVLQGIADAALRTEREPLERRMQEVVELIMEATGAQSAAVMLFKGKPEELVTSAAAGLASDELGRLISSISPSTFQGAVASSEEPIEVRDAATTELEVSDALRDSGIHSLLGVRLPPHHELVGIVYIGLTDKRSFSASEARRLEVLGEKLTLHLENARLYASLRERIAELDTERSLRERFVSVLAHDLRGPLSTARLSTQVLIRNPETLDRRREVAVRVELALNRMERMIRDLLDVNRVRAGQRLPLRLDDCDLATLAEQVVDDLRMEYGDGRIVLRRNGPVRGVWSEEELRRALWNLVSNGLKYGAQDQPVEVRIERTPKGARASVHNNGNPIPVENQARIFGAFERQREGRENAGWGLGLTLVRACAEAHGGEVTLTSNQREGTTFAIALPTDSRPFQAT